jgi:hypothetical protein
MVNTDQLGMLLRLIFYARPLDQSAFAGPKRLMSPNIGIPDDESSRCSTNSSLALDSRSSMPLGIYSPRGPSVRVFSATAAQYRSHSHGTTLDPETPAKYLADLCTIAGRTALSLGAALRCKCPKYMIRGPAG